MNFTKIFSGLCLLFKIEYHLYEQAFIRFVAQSAHEIASGFMQLAAAGHRGNLLHFHCHFGGKM